MGNLLIGGPLFCQSGDSCHLAVRSPPRSSTLGWEEGVGGCRGAAVTQKGVLFGSLGFFWEERRGKLCLF